MNLTNPYLSAAKSALPYLLSAGIGAGAAWWVQDVRVDSKQNELDRLQTQSRTQIIDAKERNVALREEQIQSLNKIKDDYEKRIPSIRDAAVAAYRLRFPATGSGAGSSAAPGAGVQVDDGAGAKCVAGDEFVADAAEDAAKVEAWRRYGVANKLPVE